jgi:hypothetical protein
MSSLKNRMFKKLLTKKRITNKLKLKEKNEYIYLQHYSHIYILYYYLGTIIYYTIFIFMQYIS